MHEKPPRHAALAQARLEKLNSSDPRCGQPPAELQHPAKPPTHLYRPRPATTDQGPIAPYDGYRPLAAVGYTQSGLIRFMSGQTVIHL